MSNPVKSLQSMLDKQKETINKTVSNDDTNKESSDKSTVNKTVLPSQNSKPRPNK